MRRAIPATLALAVWAATFAAPAIAHEKRFDTWVDTTLTEWIYDTRLTVAGRLTQPVEDRPPWTGGPPQGPLPQPPLPKSCRERRMQLVREIDGAVIATDRSDLMANYRLDSGPYLYSKYTVRALARTYRSPKHRHYCEAGARSFTIFGSGGP